MNNQMIVTVYYQNSDVVMFREKAAREQLLVEGGKKIGLSTSTWMPVGIFRMEDAQWLSRPDKLVCDDMFDYTNNPAEEGSFVKTVIRASVKEHKEFAKSRDFNPRVKHSSMSIGDIVGIERNGQTKYFLCTDSWDEIFQDGKVEGHDEFIKKWDALRAGQ